MKQLTERQAKALRFIIDGSLFGGITFTAIHQLLGGTRTGALATCKSLVTRGLARKTRNGKWVVYLPTDRGRQVPL